MASIYLSIVSVCLMTTAYSMTKNEKQELRKTVKDMFQHAYNSYMTYAHPADELMPLSCKGRYRGSEPSRGDVDDVLGNFSMTLIDSLDSLAIFGEIQDFENGVKLVLDNVKFDNDIVVSVFETNIRVLGGLLGGHVTADIFKKEGIGLSWYNGELLDMAKDIGERLLPAFNTTTGIPYPRVNLRYGVADPRSRTGTESDTCTACAGTMIMEFGALSRLTGDPKFEAAGHKAMQALWTYRSRSSDLVGTVINIHNGEWVRRDSGVGAGIDSYYEYCLKAYILLGEEDYLQRFNQHYKAVMRYINRGSLFLNVHMHNPTRLSYSFMDSLQAFWPGLQVLKGDLKSAIELHEVFYSVAKRHKFLPEAFTANFEVHWGQHFLRPELVESTYFLYEATKDSYYLEVGKYIVENLNRYTRVPCGFAAVKDVRTLSHEDRMDSFLLSETLKYLYLLFTEKDDLPIDLHDFVFTTEAHILPLALSNWNGSSAQSSVYQSEHLHDHSCPSTSREGNMMSFAEEVRRKSRSKQPESCLKQDAEAISSIDSKNSRPLLRAEQFIPGNKEHLEILKSMGITVTKTQDGKVQLMQNAAVAYTSEMAAEGIKFMQSMIELAKFRNEDGAESLPRVVQILSAPYNGNIVLNAGPAQFGVDLGKSGMAVSAEVTLADPFKGCTQLNNREAADHRIVLMERGDCMFIDKVRHAESCGAVGAIIVDNNEGSSSDSQPMFAMSGDGASSGINIPAVFLFSSEGEVLQKAMQIVSRNTGGYLRVRLAEKELKQVSGTDEPTVKSEETLTSFPESDGVQENTLKTESQQTEGDTGKHTTAKAEPPPMEERMPPVYGQDALSRVSKLIEMMKGVSRQPGYEFLKELKRSKDKPAMTSSTVSDRGRWLYDVMMMKLRDGEPLESFVLRQKAAEQADLNALNRRDEINKERNGIGISSSQGSVGDQVVKMRVTAGNSEYAATLGNSKDDTLYIIGEVNEDQATKSSHTSRVVSAEETTLGLDQGEDSGGDSEVIQEEVTDSEVERVTEKDGNRNEVGDERVMEEVGGRESVKNADEEARSNNEELATSELAVEIADGEARRREREEASESISCVDGAQIAGARAQGDRGRKSGIIQEDQQEMGKRVYGLGDGSVDGLEEDTESGKGIYSQEGNGSDGTREEERTIEGINEKRNEEMEEKAKGDEETNKKQQDGHESDEVTNEVSDQKNDVAEVDHGTENLDQIPREVKNFEDGLRTVASTGDSRKTADFDSDKESESLRSSYTEELESRLRGSIGENLNIVEELRTFDGKNVGELLEERRRTADPHTRDHSRTDKGAELEEGLSTTGEL